MFSTSNLCKVINISLYQGRYKSKTHWAKLLKKTGPKYKALNHFDDFYGSVFGSKWDTMRAGLLRTSKYVAVVNNYGNCDKTVAFLTKRGAHCLKRLMAVQQEFHNRYGPNLVEVENQTNQDRLDSYMEKVQSDDIASVYTDPGQKPERLDTKDITLELNADAEQEELKEKIPIKLKTLDESIAEAQIDQSRIIDPSSGFMSDLLYQYVPATKLKGMDEWIPESLHYSYYSKSKDFPLLIEPETNFQFPEHLKVYTYELDSKLSTFPEPRKFESDVFNYYPMDLGSVLAVLALGIESGDRVLDLCAAPGGKSLVMLQTLLPDVLVANDVSISRSNRMARVFRDYLIDFEQSNKWRERVILTKVHGCNFRYDYNFDKVLVDVPCTTDRHSLNEDENNIFRPDRIKERLKIPELQSQLLSHALSLVRVGGAVVYSTCSLSPIQNDGVVHMALKTAFQDHGITATVRDLTRCFSSLSSTVILGSGTAAPKYGQLVTPYIGANFGPSYFCRLVRTK